MRFALLTLLFAIFASPALAHGQSDAESLSPEASVSGQQDGVVVQPSALHHPPLGNAPASDGEHCPEDFCSPPSPAALDADAGGQSKPIGPIGKNGARNPLQQVHLPFDPPPPRLLRT